MPPKLENAQIERNSNRFAYFLCCFFPFSLQRTCVHLKPSNTFLIFHSKVLLTNISKDAAIRQSSLGAIFNRLLNISHVAVRCRQSSFPSAFQNASAVRQTSKNIFEICPSAKFYFVCPGVSLQNGSSVRYLVARR